MTSLAVTGVLVDAPRFFVAVVGAEVPVWAVSAVNGVIMIIIMDIVGIDHQFVPGFIWVFNAPIVFDSRESDTYVTELTTDKRLRRRQPPLMLQAAFDGLED